MIVWRLVFVVITALFLSLPAFAEKFACDMSLNCAIHGSPNLSLNIDLETVIWPSDEAIRYTGPLAVTGSTLCLVSDPTQAYGVYLPNANSITRVIDPKPDNNFYDYMELYVKADGDLDGICFEYSGALPVPNRIVRGLENPPWTDLNYRYEVLTGIDDYFDFEPEQKAAWYSLTAGYYALYPANRFLSSTPLNPDHWQRADPAYRPGITPFTWEPDASFILQITSSAAPPNGCTPGNYFDDNVGECVDASAGYFVSDNNALEQTACPVGTYSANEGASECTDASAGYFVESEAAVEQTACPIGTSQSATGQASCDAAPAGSYVSQLGAITPTVCAEGSYQPDEGQAECLAADAGFFVDASGAIEQNACDIGTYQPNSGQAACLNAEVGFYVDVVAATEQTACPLGTTTEQTGSSALSDCQVEADGESEEEEESEGEGEGEEDPPAVGSISSVLFIVLSAFLILLRKKIYIFCNAR